MYGKLTSMLSDVKARGVVRVTYDLLDVAGEDIVAKEPCLLALCAQVGVG